MYVTHTATHVKIFHWGQCGLTDHFTSLHLRWSHFWKKKKSTFRNLNIKSFNCWRERNLPLFFAAMCFARRDIPHDITLKQQGGESGPEGRNCFVCVCAHIGFNPLWQAMCKYHWCLEQLDTCSCVTLFLGDFQWFSKKMFALSQINEG